MNAWRTQAFEECIEAVTYTQKIPRREFMDDGAYPIISQEDAFINGFWDNEADVFKVTTPLVIFGDHTKVLKYVDFDFVLGADGVKVLQPREFLLPKFFFYQLQAANLDSLGYARHYKLLKQLAISFPDLPEQKRIVGILDEAFGGIATAKANAERNVKNARALFESQIQSILTQRGEGWVERPLASLCSRFVDSAHRTPKYETAGIPALRPRDVVNGTLSLRGAARVSQEEYEIQSRRHHPAPGDIVYSRELSYGWAARLPEEPRVCLSQGMCLFRPTPDLSSSFLLYVLNGPVGREQATRAAVGAAHPHINLADIKAYVIPTPPLGEQERIVRRLDAMATRVERLESVFGRKQSTLEALRKALLHQSFAGQL